MLKQLTVVSYLSPNLFWLYQAVSSYLARVLDTEVQIHQSWNNPLDDLSQQPFDLAFICGLPFIQYCQTVPEQLQALVAPVMQADRYQNRPIYFSDVIVYAASELNQFEQLAGKRFCFNDLGSNSGYNLMRYQLMQGNYSSRFFAEVMQSGSHQQSIQWVLQQKADCAAIDSVVLEQELRQSSLNLRVIESIGPTPMPPLVAARHLGEPCLQQLQAALLNPDAELLSHMQQAGIRRFAAVQTCDYQIIHQIYEQTNNSEYAVIESALCA
jgi:phosphonate transport system substrate-binding protein